MSARKARPVADLVRGLPVKAALDQLQFIPRRAAPLLTKVIRSAAANASQEGGHAMTDLFIASARIDDGPLKQGRLRFRPGPMGRACPIHKRTCHIKIVLGVIEGPQSRRRAPKTEEKN